MANNEDKRTIYIHRTKEENLQIDENPEYRVVTFVNGNRDILQIIKDLIKDQSQS